MKKVFIFLVGLLSILSLCACNNEKVHEHNPSENWSSDKNDHWKTCDGCSELLDKASHSFGSWETVKDATEEEVGSKKRVCGECGYEETAEIAKLEHSHSLSDWVNDLNEHWKTCGSCGEIVDKASHTWDNGVEDSLVTLEKGNATYTCTTCGYSKKEEVLPYTKVGALVSKTWTNYEAFTMYVRRDEATVSVRFVSDNTVFTSEGRYSKLELYFVTGDKVDVRDGNNGVSRITIYSDKSHDGYSYGDRFITDYKVNINDNGKTVIDVVASYEGIGTTKDEIFGLTCGLWSEVDADWAPMTSLDSTNLAAVEIPSQYVRVDKDGKCFVSAINDYPENIPTPDYDKTTLTIGYPYGVAEPEDVKNNNGDDIYVKVTNGATGFKFDMIGFGNFSDTEYLKLVLHTSETDGAGWGIQASDVSFLISKTKATKKSGLTDFWGYTNFTSEDTLANHQPVYELNELGYFTLSFEVDYTEIIEYNADSEVSFIMLEFDNGVIYNAEPWNTAMTKDGVGVGDAALQSSYQIIKDKNLTVDKDAIIADYKYKFSTNYYANIERTDYTLVLNLVSFNTFDNDDFIRFIVDTDATAVNGVWALDSNDVGFVIYKDVVYLTTGKTSFWDGEAQQFHSSMTTLNTPTYKDYGEYWTLSIEIDYSELGLAVTKDSALKGLLIQFNPSIQNSGFNFNGYVPVDVALQSNYFEIK